MLLISRLSVLSVTRKRSFANCPIGCCAYVLAAPVCKFEVGQSSSGILRSLIYEASGPSFGVLPEKSMSSIMRTPCPILSAPQICIASQIDGNP
ncbi:unannotated protein [freshwater metagenome]|uniref:Unannotated protein n=1 Tax=freshwater metagenome TaxID=449393 RepID=A0A6J6BSI9_9ZZZZ